MYSVIFDLDGTLWDVTDSTVISANIVAKKHGLSEVGIDTVRGCFGFNREDSAKTYFPGVDLEKSVELIDEFELINIERLKNNAGTIYPDVKSVLTALHDKYDLYIVSNTSLDEYIEAFLNSAGVKDLFKGYIAASKLQITKSDAIKKVIADNKIEKAVYVGDTEIDLNAAKLSEIPFIYVKYGFGKGLNANLSVQSMSELPKLLAKAFKF